MITLRIPLASGALVEATLPRPMAPADWEQLLAVLDAMRPGLVSEDGRDA